MVTISKTNADNRNNHFGVNVYIQNVPQIIKPLISIIDEKLPNVGIFHSDVKGSEQIIDGNLVIRQISMEFSTVFVVNGFVVVVNREKGVVILDNDRISKMAMFMDSPHS